ncbi:uncharacterized protein LOC105426844 [Pogonomyrmex barbatus]|uniref:Uncharacterized protein LOC105426844 n=1 Tax=Pogonomyrmex barbatus TaxID=144034 RepID=A0A6I9W821_9HYME|nr:uncharacterized protein LOC105426844 [Pogonomyrmex barbatus]
MRTEEFQTTVILLSNQGHGFLFWTIKYCCSYLDRPLLTGTACSTSLPRNWALILPMAFLFTEETRKCPRKYQLRIEQWLSALVMPLIRRCITSLVESTQLLESTCVMEHHCRDGLLREHRLQ